METMNWTSTTDITFEVMVENERKDAKSEMAKYHDRVVADVTIRANGKEFETPYFYNKRFDLKAEDVLYSTFMDASCYAEYEDDIDGFANEFCSGDKVTEVLRTYEACKRAYQFVLSVCGDEWYDVLDELSMIC